MIYRDEYPYLTSLPVRPPLLKRERHKRDSLNGEAYIIVEQSAYYPGGMSAFYKSIQHSMRYPARARKSGIEGRVFVEFVIDKQGVPTNVKAIKGIGGGCDEEAVKAIINAGNWYPGEQRGKAVKQKIVLPITFKLG
jgi:protein TonB